jgi:hypothetical protein
MSLVLRSQIGRRLSISEMDNNFNYLQQLALSGTTSNVGFNYTEVSYYKIRPYKFYLENEIIDIEEKDIYCFEASLYKHWTNEFNSKRVFLSFGIIIPYETMNISENDPRVRLSKRISKYFLKV